MIDSRHSWTMSGGMLFGRYRHDDTVDTFDLPEPSEVVIPVGIPQPDLPVRVGDSVCTGQPLIGPDQIIPRHFHLASITGTVAGFVPHGKGMRAPVSVILARSSGDERCGERFIMPGTAEAAREVLVRSGAMHAAVPDVGRWLLRPSTASVASVVVACFATGPLEPRQLSMACPSSHMIEGLAVWRLATGGAHIALMVAADEYDSWQKLGGLPDGVRIYPCPRRYPAEHPVIMACRCLGHDLPGGQTALDAGVLALDLQAVCAAGEVMATGQPLHHVRVQIVGEGVTRPVTVSARIGTRAGDLMERSKNASPLLVAGGVLAGEHLDPDSPILPHHGRMVALPRASCRFLGFLAPAMSRPSWTTTVLSSLLTRKPREARAELGGEPRPCISCGACEEVCPRQISPSHLARIADGGYVEEMEQFGIDRCIECGLCSYVCPSKIELMATIQRGIHALAAEHAA